MKRVTVFAVLVLGVVLVGGLAAQDEVKDPATTGRQPGEPVHPFVPRGASPFCIQPNAPIPDDCDDNPPCLDSTIVMSETFELTDLNVSVDITHTFLGDLELRLTSPQTAVTLIWDDPCGGENDMSVEIDDEAPPVVCAEPLIGTFSNVPGALAAFDGDTATGNWTLTVTDTLGADVGVLNEWCLVTTPPVPVELQGFDVQ
ncbi:MAG: proprotein convertase P-domain-containing protein [Acidobacteriota bacterium]|nr:proprotein convertase P-domain-containing protein [Acidobacteriota bacterium]MDH3525423.1 proprotein convertase P-domain-containing protein [Acidobacteriota bacterium]